MLDTSKASMLVKALHCCTLRHPEDSVRCKECPMKDIQDAGGYCVNRLKAQAADMLEELETENMKYRKIVELVKAARDTLREILGDKI